MGSKKISSRIDYKLSCLDEEIDKNSVVRLIDAFVDTFNLKEMGFNLRETKQYGRNAYPTKSLVKLYIYSYFHKTRSSRQIARQCVLNIELHWLIGNLQPSYKTISEFRKNNIKGITHIFKEVNKLIANLGLYDDVNTIAVDGTRMHGQNSRLNNYNEDKLKSLIKRGEKEIENYLSDLEESDKNDVTSTIKDEIIKDKIAELTTRLNKNKSLQERLIKSGETQISTTDPDSKRMGRLRDGSIVGYNGQTAVSDEHKLIVAADVKNIPDTNTLSHMSIEAKKNMGKDKLDVLADCGFATGEELYKCEEESITPYVPSKNASYGKSKGDYSKEKFEYEKEEDYYMCPEKKRIDTTGKILTLKRKGRKTLQYKEYFARSKDCQTCPVREKCLAKGKLKKGLPRSIVRYEYEEYKVKSNKRVVEDKPKYKKRKGIVEHPYGTFKRSFDFSYFLLIGLEKVNAEFNLVCSCYNLKRLITIFGIKELIKLVKSQINLVFSLIALYYAHRTQNRLNIRRHYRLLC